jgi:hydrogenase maturation factor
MKIEPCMLNLVLNSPIKIIDHMILFYGRISEIFTEHGLTMGRIRIGGTSKAMPLALVDEPAVGDTVLVCDGVVISKVQDQQETEADYVPGNSRKST